MSSQVVRVNNGQTVNVRTGVLRGAGPQGPVGPQGPAGPRGDEGPKGDTATIDDSIATLWSTTSVAVDNAQWYDLALGTIAVDEDILGTATAPAFTVKDSGRYLVTVTVEFGPLTQAGETGSRMCRIYSSDSAEIIKVIIPGADAGNTLLVFSDTLDLVSTTTYVLQGRSTDTSPDAIACTYRKVSLVRVGAGKPGPTGPQGPAGGQGIQGPAGPTGSAGGGYTSNDALIGGAAGTSDDDPGGTALTTADQGIPYPNTSQKPALPWFFNLALVWLEKRIIARYVDNNDKEGKRPLASAQPGEVHFQTGNKAIYLKSTSKYVPLAQVEMSTAAPVLTAGAYPPGTIWLKV